MTGFGKCHDNNYIAMYTDLFKLQKFDIMRIHFMIIQFYPLKKGAIKTQKGAVETLF